MERYRLGAVDVVFWSDPADQRVEHAAALGFEHIDVMVDIDPATLALPVGCPTAYPSRPRGGVRHPHPRVTPVPTCGRVRSAGGPERRVRCSSRGPEPW